jgi:F-type H+-transporting ATPase subunit a
MTGASVPLAAELEPGEFHVPTLEELFQYPAYWFSEGWTFFGLFDIGFNRVAMLSMLSVVVVSGLMLGAFRQPKIIPGKFQALMESFVSFIRDYIVIEVIGPKGLKFVPFLATLFLFIWVNNIFKVTPFIIFPSTGRMGLPAFLACIALVVFVVVGIREQGAGHYFKNIMIPPGVPWPVLIILAPIELLSTLIVRPFTLAIRLFANMMAGHILIALSTIAVNAFLFDVHNIHFDITTLPLGIVMLGVAPLVFAFEMLVSTLQAYIFTTLTAVYIAGALHPEH